MNYQSFDFLKQLYFVRTSGSAEERKAAELLKNEAVSLGVQDVQIEPFPVDGYRMKHASLTLSNRETPVECAGVGMSGSTVSEGVTAGFVYVSSMEDAKVKDVCGKVCLIHSKLVNYKIYRYLAEQQAAALILCTGSLYKEDADVDLGPYMYRERHYQYGKIPAVCIRMRQAEEILRNPPETVTVSVQQEEFKNQSANVIATIPGTSGLSDILCFTAHYDSVSFSKGAYDNGTGAVCLLQLLSYFAEHRPYRTLKFIWCGSEECGLLGSKAYVRQHSDELTLYLLNINIDMLANTIGHDIAVATAEKSVVTILKYEAMTRGFGLSAKQGVYSSDSTPFADAGIPAISFARSAPAGGATIHSHDDVIDYLSEENYYRSCNFIIAFAERLISAVSFPLERTIPENMKTELDYYLGRKDRPED